MKKILLCCMLIMGGLLSQSSITCFAMEKPSEEIIEISPRWWGTGTTGWLTDGAGISQVKISFDYQDSPSPRILAIHGVTEYRPLVEGVTLEIVRINVPHISANGLSLDCSLYVKYRNSLDQVFEIYPRVIIEI